MKKIIPTTIKGKVLGLAFIGLVLAAAYFVNVPLITVTPETDPALTIAGGEQLYTCGMHPQVIQNKPGNCPICGMKLMPVHKKNGPDAQPGESAKGEGPAKERKIKFYKSTMSPGEASPTPGKDSMGMDMVPVYEGEADASSIISIDPVTAQNMGIRTALVARGPLRKVVRTVGAIDFDETTLVDVTTKFKGWIEELHVDATGRQVHRGEPLFEIYSPDLYSAQREFLLTLNQGGGGESMRSSALTKLKFFDISDEQIEELRKTKQVKKTLSVNAPMDGIVVEKHVVKGQVTEPGEKLYRLADLALVWVQSQVYEQDLGFVRLGQEAVVSLSYLPDRKFRGRVTYIYPTVDEKTRTAKVRMEFHNPGFFLKPGMFATVELRAEIEPSVLLAPDSSVLRSGEKNTVFVALDGGRFEPREVSLGLKSENDMYQVLSGLSEGERVVASGQFMLDSESQLREAIQKMLRPGAEKTAKAPESHEEHAGHVMEHQHGEGADKAASQALVYICPMPEHVAIQYQHPGKCPLCGMALAPVSQDQLAQIRPGAPVEYYTCPLPEHSEVREDKPGKCPRCGMTLIPVMKGPLKDGQVERADGHSKH
ncbi:MAG: efflux RND transporter periplasmic adaptor subunit [Nitrospinae bacterium]|nr:efflux RND transporter periplasmic adaptor subunit [Nitrospinota bacterium]